MSTDILFTPISAGALTLRNRIVMAPLTRSRSSEDGIVPSFAADYYAQRAGAGLIVSEATNISPQARGYAMTPGIWNVRQVDAWRGVTDAVHAKGGLMVLQLWHTGRISHPDLHGGNLPVAPSAIRPVGQAFTRDGMKDHVTPRALETDEIPRIVEDYRNAARCARAAGFDGVEVHAANNYLLEQFIRDSTNTRDDRYGGSVENRIRFPVGAVRAVTEEWGGGDRVGIRLSPGTTMPGETPLDGDPAGTYGALLTALKPLGLAYVHMIEGVTQQKRDQPKGLDAAWMRRHVDGMLIGNNGYSAEMAAEAIHEKRVDAVSFGRPFIANPDLVERLRTGAPLAEAPKQYWYGGGSVGYSDWPSMPSGD